MHFYFQSKDAVGIFTLMQIPGIGLGSDIWSKEKMYGDMIYVFVYGDMIYVFVHLSFVIFYPKLHNFFIIIFPKFRFW